MSRYHASHISSTGPGDARPTAQQIIQDEHLAGTLSGKVMLITGTSSGIGIPTVRALAATGATLYCTVRNLAKGREALSDVLEPGKVELVEMDNESLESVRRAAGEVLRRSKGVLNVLVANAGVMMCPEAKSVDGFERQFAVNHLAHFLLFQLCKGALLEGAKKGGFESRVVLVSSMGHKWGPVKFGDYNFTDGTYAPGLAYGQAKTANIYMANQIERLYGPQGLHATSLHPGGIMTGLQVYVSEETKKTWAANPGVMEYMKNAEQGAATTVLCAVGREWEGKGGKYLEDCEVADPEETSRPVMGGERVIGYAPHAYDPASEERLWKDSLGMIGIDSAA